MKGPRVELTDDFGNRATISDYSDGNYGRGIQIDVYTKEGGQGTIFLSTREDVEKLATLLQLFY
jgi:hypothetical protein